tara:strand:+ start:15485 stop:16087 length:603 start_codon:yes stop_codon:yes gene_type:complete
MKKVLIINSAVLLLAGISVASQEPSESSTAVLARQLESKLEQLSNRAGAPSAIQETVVVTEPEINAYLEERMREAENAGVVSLNVTLRENARVSIEAVIDFSSLDETKRRGALDLLNYVRGQVPVRFDGTLSGRNGVGTVSVETFTVAGLPLPPAVFRELVMSYTASEGVSEGVDVSQAFELPYEVEGLKVEHGRIVIVR